MKIHSQLEVEVEVEVGVEVEIELGKATKSIFTIPAQFQPQLQPQLQLQPQAVNVSSHLSANTGTELP